MRMNMIKVLYTKAIQKYKLGPMLYPFFCRHRYLNINDDVVNKSLEYLESVHGAKDTNYKTDNIISHDYDLHIILPCYNVEKYLSKCIDSILNCEKQYSFLLTIVNDGSTDSTPQIIDKYIDHPNVEIIHGDNQGLSIARNRALKHIKGKYIMFVDSDDYVDYSNVEKMLDIAFGGDYDIVEGSYTFVDDQDKHYRTIGAPSGDISPRKLRGFSWGKVIRSEFFETMKFPDGFVNQDSIFAQVIYPTVKSAYALGENVYYYRVNHSGITKTSRGKPKSLDSLWLVRGLHIQRLNNGFNPDQEDYEYLLRNIKLTYKRTHLISNKVNEAVFVVFVDMMNRYFPDFKTNEDFYKPLEKALRESDFGMYSAFCMYK